MIIQDGPPAQPCFAIAHAEHARVAARLTAAFGNEYFRRPSEPWWAVIGSLVAGHPEACCLRVPAAEIGCLDLMRQVLESVPATAESVDGAGFFSAYLWVQWFDALALYLQVSHPAVRRPHTFLHVPREIGQYTSMEATPVDYETVALAPYPFRTEVAVTTHGRFVGRSWPPGLARAPRSEVLAEQRVRLVPSREVPVIL